MSDVEESADRNHRADSIPEIPGMLVAIDLEYGIVKDIPKEVRGLGRV